MQQDGRVVTPDTILNRIRGEYREMPGLRLRREQAQRLWGLDEQTCSQLLESLVQAGFLSRSADGHYGHTSLVEKGTAAPQMAKAALVSAPTTPARAHDAA